MPGFRFHKVCNVMMSCVNIRRKPARFKTRPARRVRAVQLLTLFVLGGGDKQHTKVLHSSCQPLTRAAIADKCLVVKVCRRAILTVCSELAGMTLVHSIALLQGR